MSVALSYDILTRNLDRTLQTTAKQGTVKLESENYLKKIASITSIDEFLKDTRTFTYAMKAFGLEDMAYAKGYMKKILQGGVTERNSLANRTNDPKIQQFAATFDFNTYKEDTTKRDAVRQGVVDKYVRQTLEVNAGETDGEGVRLALYFQRMASSIKSPLDILADRALSQVVRTALGMPDAMATADIDKQTAAIAKRIDVADFQDPAKVKRFITRFAAMYDATAGQSSDPRLALFSPQQNVSLNMAMSISSLKLGGR